MYFKDALWIETIYFSAAETWDLISYTSPAFMVPSVSIVDSLKVERRMNSSIAAVRVSYWSEELLRRTMASISAILFELDVPACMKWSAESPQKAGNKGVEVFLRLVLYRIVKIAIPT
jgi:hypothetical protein